MNRAFRHPLVDRVLKAFSLVVTDRRWAAPLSAAALGFGLFVGVAIGPGASGTLATGAQQIVELPAPGGAGGEEATASAKAPPPSEGAQAAPFEPAPEPAQIPLAAGSSEPPLPVAEEPAPEPEPEPAPGPTEAQETDPESQALSGTVVHANATAGSYALAIAGGELVSVHAAKLPAPGVKLSLSAHRLANGTFAEEDDHKVKGHTGRATIQGAISFIDPSQTAPAYTVSGRGASLLVHVRPDPTGAAPALPPLGSYVTATVTIEAPQPATAAPLPPPAEAATGTVCVPDPALPPLPKIAPKAVLWQSSLEIEAGEPSTYLDLAGVVEELCPASSQLLLSSDDAGEGAGSLTLRVPPTIDAAKLERGDSILATATVEADGSLALSGLVSDERVKGADDAGTAQGDLKR